MLLMDPLQDRIRAKISGDGKRLLQERASPSGHACRYRLHAEDSGPDGVRVT